MVKSYLILTWNHYHRLMINLISVASIWACVLKLVKFDSHVYFTIAFWTHSAMWVRNSTHCTKYVFSFKFLESSSQHLYIYPFSYLVSCTSTTPLNHSLHNLEHCLKRSSRKHTHFSLPEIWREIDFNLIHTLFLTRNLTKK